MTSHSGQQASLASVSGRQWGSAWSSPSQQRVDHPPSPPPAVWCITANYIAPTELCMHNCCLPWLFFCPPIVKNIKCNWSLQFRHENRDKNCEGAGSEDIRECSPQTWKFRLNDQQHQVCWWNQSWIQQLTQRFVGIHKSILSSEFRIGKHWNTDISNISKFVQHYNTSYSIYVSHTASTV